jgi:hypothetical protein
MSSGGIFKLITNSGIQDKLLMATDYLNYRIKQISRKNMERIAANRGKKTPFIDLDDSWIPDINAISKSHAIFIDGAFKPFVASGFEYNKSQAQGTANLGTSVKFTLPVFGDFINDCVVHVKLTELRAVNSADRVRYVAMIGHKLFKKVSFKINAAPLDSYTSEDYNAYFQFHVPPAKRTGWLRNVGQEIPENAYVTGDPTFDMFREYKIFGDGNQTFKQAHAPIDLWIPLLFWFRNIENALPNLVIPYGQTDITIDLASASEIVGFADYGGGGTYKDPKIDSITMYMNNIFMQPEITKIFMCKFGFSLIRVHGRHVSYNTSLSNDNLHLSGLKWPTETLYVCFKPVKNETLSQCWHKCSQLTLNNIKVPVVAKNSTTVIILAAGVAKSTSNTASSSYVSGIALSAVDNAYNGYDLVITEGTGFDVNDVTKNRYTVYTYVGAGAVTTILGVWNNGLPDTSTRFELYTPQVLINVAQYYKESPAIDTLSIKAHGIVIYREMSESFYNSYLPYRFGKKMNTPEDRGWYMINFNYLPGEHQPSGHINLSRAREFYMNYTSSVISSANKVNITVLSDCINFLLVKDGTAALRYST